MPTVLRTHRLRKQYKEVVALKGLDLDVQRGEVFGFLGANGAGKTTFTKCVTGFVRPTSGSVEILGVDAVNQPVRVAPHVGLVPDQYDFYGNLTGRQHLDFYGRLHGMRAGERRDRIDEVIALVRMEERADRRMKGYSHGMKQRICIAQAILHQPDLIFFDEPTNGLDPKGAYELREMIRGLARDGTTIFLNSHVLPEVEQVCDRVAILVQGELRTMGRIQDLRRQRGASLGTVKVRLLNAAKRHETVVSRHVKTPRLDGDTLEFQANDEGTAAAVAALVGDGAKIATVTAEQASLESIFLGITEADV